MKIYASWIKKEDDGTYVVKAVYSTSSVYGYGDTLQKALEDASDILTSSYRRTIKVYV